MASTDNILRRALWLVLPPTFVVLAIVAVASSTTVHDTASAELEKRLSRVTDQSAEAISATFKTIVDAAISLARNDLVVNSIVDAESRSSYIPMLFGSLRIPGPLDARISLSDYRGRLIATNGIQIKKTKMGAARKAELLASEVTIQISRAGLIVAVPVLYNRQPEALILVEYGPESLADLVRSPTGGHEIVLKNTDDELLFASSFDLARAKLSDDRWIVSTRSIPSFSSLRVTVGEPREAAFAAVDRQAQFLLVAIAISFVAVVVGICATALLVKAPLINALDQVNEANKTKSLFLASMSHEIRTPLNGVLGMASLLNDGTLTAEQRDRVDTIQVSGETLLSLLNDILDLSKIEAGRLELEIIDFGIPRVIEEVRGLWQPQVVAKGLGFNCEFDPDDLSPVKTDPTRVKQIIFNFISNAQKFTETGAITLRVSQQAAPEGLIETRYEVHDTGIGINAEGKKSLFETFKQADNSITRKYGGTGLGLAISKNLAEAMGGEIGMDSTPGSGSCFWFTTVSPAGDINASAEEAISDDMAAEGGERTLRILIAEDNKVNQAVVRAIIERANHRADMVGNGLEAVSAVIRAPYDLILMDVQMPEMDGMTATRRIRELEHKGADTSIIALTANAMKGDRELYLQTGADDYVSKPIDPQALFAAIRRTCGKDVAVAYRNPSPAEQEKNIPDQQSLDDLDALLNRMDEATA